jgi:hypothetical protein
VAYPDRDEALREGQAMKTATMRGKRWNVRNVSALPIGELGECNYDERTLRIPTDGDTEAELDTCIHEALHGCLPDLAEDAVEETATSIASLLWRLGWRKDP